MIADIYCYISWHFGPTAAGLLLVLQLEPLNSVLFRRSPGPRGIRVAGRMLGIFSVARVAEKKNSYDLIQIRLPAVVSKIFAVLVPKNLVVGEVAATCRGGGRGCVPGFFCEFSLKLLVFNGR